MLHGSLETSGASKLSSLDYKIITQLLISRVLAEVDCLTSADDLLREVQSLTVRVALTLLGSEADDDDDDDDDTFTDMRHSEVREVVLDWLNGKPTPWQETLQKELKGFVSLCIFKVV